MSTVDPPSKAARIAAAVAARLATIRKTNGYRTDAGAHVWRGRIAIDQEALPSTTLYEDEDLVETQRITSHQNPQSVDVNDLLPFVIETTATCDDPDNPNLTGHELIADLKRAIFGADHTWGGLAKGTRYVGRSIAPRADGSNLVSVTLRIQVAIVENLANP